MNNRILSNQYRNMTADPKSRFMIDLVLEHPVHYQKPKRPKLTPWPGYDNVPGEIKDSGPLIQYCLEELGSRGCDPSTFCRDIIFYYAGFYRLNFSDKHF